MTTPPGHRINWRTVEIALFAAALAVQLGAIALRSSGRGFTEVVVSNWMAVGSYLLGLAGVFVRYRGWRPEKKDPANHSYYLLASPLAGVGAVAVTGSDPTSGFTDTALVVPGLIASSLAWGWAHNTRPATKVHFTEATETARTIFWGWMSIGVLTVIQWLSQRIGGKEFVVPDLLYSVVSIGSFLILVSTGYTQYQRALADIQKQPDAKSRPDGRPTRDQRTHSEG